MNNKIKEYAKTVIFSIIIVTFLCFVAELELLFRTEKSVTYKQLNVANLSKFCTIEELEKKLAQNPDDYFINIRLGQMYETIGKLDKANDFYKNALKLSGRSNFALYSYALFCAKNDLYVFAATLAEELEGTSNNVNLYRAKIYEQIAKSLDKAKNYQAATKSYQIVYKYAKSIGDMKYLSQVKTDYSEEYVKLADYHIEQEDIEQAVCDLENSIKIKETPIANYKLGLIYLTSDLEKAEKHINKAIFKDPFIVNPYIYNSVLTKLISQAELLNNGGLLNYYSSRMNRFKKLLKTSYLYKNQVVVENSALVKTKKLFKKEKTTLFFELKNNTDDVLKDLLIKVELFVNGEKYVMEKKIVTPLNQIEPYETLKSTDFVLSDDVKFGNLKQNDDVFVRYFARRTDDAPWILIKIDFINN